MFYVSAQGSPPPGSIPFSSQAYCDPPLQAPCLCVITAHTPLYCVANLGSCQDPETHLFRSMGRLYRSTNGAQKSTIGHVQTDTQPVPYLGGGEASALRSSSSTPLPVFPIPEGTYNEWCCQCFYFLKRSHVSVYTFFKKM